MTYFSYQKDESNKEPKSEKMVWNIGGYHNEPALRGQVT